MTALSLPELLARSARGRPDQRAVVADRTLTYAELDDLAGRVAGALASRGVKRGDRVGVFAPKSAGAIAALYGIMRAGAAYVPIDPASPVARAGHIARDCGISALVADAEHRELIRPELPDSVLTSLDVDGLDSLPAADATGEPGPQDLAYVLYTSGSTGSPKGVMISHRNALSFVEWAAAELGCGPDDVFSSHAPLHFDLSVFDLYACALVGGTLHPLPADAMSFGESSARSVAERGITVWYSVPSALVMWVTQGGVEPSMLSSLRQVVFAGEVFPTPYLRKLRGLLPTGTGLNNWYGPTETNVCTYHVVTDQDLAGDSPIPIGRPCAGYPCEVMAEDGSLGEEGELLVGGPAVTSGYWADPQKTAAALVPNPRGGQDLWYRTGDLVVRRPDGEYLFLGRRDHQVKIRGYRVEPGEVEMAIYSDERIKEACVIAIEDERLGHDLVAFVVSADPLTEVEVKRTVASLLPRYMVPATVHVRTEALPKTSTGKIDRLALAREGTDA